NLDPCSDFVEHSAGADIDRRRLLPGGFAEHGDPTILPPRGAVSRELISKRERPGQPQASLLPVRLLTSAATARCGYGVCQKSFPIGGARPAGRARLRGSAALPIGNDFWQTL